MSEARWQRQKRFERWSGKLSADLDAEEFERAKIAGYEPGPDGYMTGRDPRHMSPDELEAMGHQQMSTLDALRRKCLDCCADSPHEVRRVWRSPAVLAVPHGQEPVACQASEERLAAMRESG